MRKIRNKILFTMMLLTLLPMLLVGGYSFYTSTEAIRESALKDKQIQLVTLREHLNTYLINSNQGAKSGNSSGAVSSGFSNQQVLAGAQTVLEKFSKQQSLSASIYLLDSSGQELAFIESKIAVKNDLTEASDSLDLQDFKVSKSRHIVESKSEIGLSIPVLLRDASQPQGYLVSISDKSQVFKPLRDYLVISLIIVGICLLLSFLFAIILSNS